MKVVDNGEKIADARGILWDLDNTLYPLTPNFSNHFNARLADVAREWGVDLPHAELVALAEKSMRDYGYSGRIFIERFGFDRAALHHRIHEVADETLLSGTAELADHLEHLTLDHAIITHGSYDWACRVLNHIGLDRWFPAHRIHALETFDFHRKSESRRPFEQGLKSLGLNGCQVMMVEDTLHNLKVPHEMGMTTVLVTQGELPPRDLPGYVDIVCDDALAFVKMVRALKEGLS
ncbi:MAG: HAD hydrolase-like protein [Micavibrio aeruginosavorus]|uniref:phosphoglycolate phosphatase n=1 Tax=Micavibrio aeruginosavorus TaxID=349221 RepID=A0A7T5R2D9_9BACT|nr:MAG: HAD hydrolase-like protein [Micavibrio aeruginosavorus]